MLSEQDRALLEFEASHARATGSKQDLIAHQFGMTSTRYFQALNRALDKPEALELMPVEVNRMRRLRDARVKRRGARLFGSDVVSDVPV